MTVRFILVSLLAGVFYAAANPPVRLPIFPEGERIPDSSEFEGPELTFDLNEQLYPLGWSLDGKRLAVLREHPDDARGEQDWTFEVIDLKVDKVVITSAYLYETGTTVAEVWEEKGAEIEKVLSDEKIEMTKFELMHFPGHEGPYRGEVLEARLSLKHGKDPYTETEALRSVDLKLVSNIEETKPVFTKTWKKFCPLAVAVPGYIRNPKGDRIAMVLVTTWRGFEGPPHMRSLTLIGAGIGNNF